MSVIIPNWNGLQHLDECFRSLASQSYQDFEILFVDNASSDGSVDWVRSHYPDTHIIERPDNAGFSAMANDGITASKAEFVALLNNDTAVDERWLAELVAALDDRQDFDFAACLMLLYFEHGKVNAAGDIYRLPLLAGQNRGLRKREAGYLGAGRVLGASAGASIYRRTMFDEVGLFDRDFFLMSEDTDINLRALIAGKKCLYVPTARVRHKVRASIDREPSREMQRLADRNEGIVVGKDFPAPLLVTLPLLYVWRNLRKTLLVGPSAWRRIPSLLAYAPSRISAEIEGFAIGWRKRDDVWSRRRSSYWDIIRWMVRGWRRLD